MQLECNHNKLGCQLVLTAVRVKYLPNFLPVLHKISGFVNIGDRIIFSSY